MTNGENKPDAGKDGVHEFTMQIGGRELSCRVVKEGDKLKVDIDDHSSAELEVHWDGTIAQTCGNALTDSQIEFIKKSVLGQDK